jgi:hypothetical protein
MAVAGTASNDVWAVGDDGASTVIEHWDGSGWSVVPSPNPVSNARNRLSGVVALSPSNAYAVGTATTGYVASRPGSPLASNPAGAILLHWNGTAWKAIDMAGLGGNQIRAISASGLRDVWLAGAFDVGTDHVELAAHGHGATWSPTTTVRMGTGGVPLGIASRTAGDVWLVGAYNRRAYPYTERTMVQHYDGASWQGIRSPNAGPNDTRLNGVAVAGSTVWAVGSYWDDAFNGHALIEGYC